MNFPHDHPLYQGSQWNHPFQNAVLAEADVILVLDSDVPWIPSVSRPDPAARIFHVDVDPLKSSMALWYIGAHAHLPRRRRHRARATKPAPRPSDDRPARRSPPAARTMPRSTPPAPTRWRGRSAPSGETITPALLTAAVREAIGEDSIVLNEGITNYPAIVDHLRAPGPARSSPAAAARSAGTAAPRSAPSSPPRRRPSSR